MMELLVFVAVALLLLLFLLIWALPRPEGPSPGTERPDAHELLTTFPLRLPSRALGERIFAPEDWEFLLREGVPAGIRQLFLEERRRLALDWLQRTRAVVQELMEFHRRAVRRHLGLKPAVEMKLGARYASLLLLCFVLQGLFWFRGPFVARRVVGYATRLAEGFASLTGQLWAGLSPSQVGRIRTDWHQEIGGRAAGVR